MTGGASDLAERWRDPAFVSGIAPLMALLRCEGADIEGADLRGIALGPPEQAGVHDLPLFRRVIRSTDLSFARVGSALFEAQIEDSRFIDCAFDGVSFGKAHVTRSKFDGSAFVASTFNDAVFEDVAFVNTTFQDRKELGCRLLRARFARCDWSGARLKNVELRASQFADCQFEGTRFEWCDLRGAKFLRRGPTPGQMIECRI